MSFWQEFMLRILWLLGVKGDFVEKIVIEAVAGQLPQITITRAFASEGEVRQIVDVFTAAKWDLTAKGPEQSFEEFKKELSKKRS